MAKISKREKKDSTKKFKFLKGLGGGLLIGLLVGAIGLFAFEKYDPPDESKGVSPATVFERIVAQDEMVSASQSYVITDRVVDKNRFFDLFDIPFTENSFWYRYSGVLKAGVNLQDARINTSGSTITITLAQPYVISNEPDMEKSGVLEEKITS